MYQHVIPAKMVPARGGRLGAVLRKVALYFVLPVLLVGGAGWAVVATVGTGWIADIFAPPPPPQTVTETEPLDIGFGPGPDAPVETGLPPIEGDAEEIRSRGISLLGEKNYPEAIRYLESAANVGTDDALAYYHLGLAYLAVADRPHAIDDAELAFRTAASLQPDWGAAHRMLAESLVRGGFYEEAIGPALEATRLEPTMSEAWLTLSAAYKGAGRDSEATEAYAEATRHSPAPPMSP
jgi:tetratricopeptide (TPR) repeat protein